MHDYKIRMPEISLNAGNFTQKLIILFDLDIRLVEEVKEKCNGVSLQNEDVYMNAGFEDFASCVIRRFRGIEDKEPFTYDAVSSLTYMIIEMFSDL